jgi:Helix-turn-helix domain
MTYPRNAQPVGAGSGGADAEKAAFLRDLRALRDHAGLGSRDLAARAHFPEDTLKTAEAGPALPSLPVLQAYVRGCGAGETEWEDRWRRLNAADAAGASALPTRAPATSRPPARVMPFPEPDAGPNPAEQDAIGFGLARVVRGLAPIDPGPTPGGGGWFDPAPRAPSPDAPSPGSMFTPQTPAPSAPPAPEGNPGAPTVQYPALSGYQAPEASYPGSYQSPGYKPPAYEPPEMFRTPAPEPPSPPPPATPGSGSTLAGLGTQAAGSAVPPAPPMTPGSAGLGSGPAGAGLDSTGRGLDSAGTGLGAAGSPATAGTPAPSAFSGPRAPSAPTGPSASSGSAATSGPLAASSPSPTSGPLSASASPTASGSAKAHAAPASSRRRTVTGAIAAVIAVLVIAVVVALILLH